MQLDRIFVDANVLVSAVAFAGNERKLIKLALNDKITPIFSEVVLIEARRVVDIKFPALSARLEQQLELLKYEVVSDIEPALIGMAAELVRDPGDVEILAGILQSKPDYAITGDKDLLTDEVKAVAPVCRCAEYLELITKD